MPDPNTPETQTTTIDSGADANAANVGANTTQQPPAARRPSVDDLPEPALKLRLDQERAKGERALLERFGVSTPEELNEKLKKLGAHEEDAKKRAADDEEKRRASMSKEEQLATENTQLKARVTELENENAKLRGNVGSLKLDQQVRTILGEYIKADMHDEARALFASHVKSIAEMGDKTKLEELQTPGGQRTFFRNLAAKKPVYALGDTTTPAGAQGAKPPVKAAPPKKPITTGAAPAKVTPPANQTVTPAKTMRPGQKNSMSNKEVADAVSKKYGAGARVPGITG